VNLLNPLFLTPALSGSIFIMAGFVLLKFPPTKINGINGYRTPRSMRSQEEWDFAQTYSAKQLIKYGLVSLTCSVIGLFISVKENLAVVVGVFITILFAVIPIIRTEKALKTRFKNQSTQ